MSDERAEAVIPVAAALVQAVAGRDAHAIKVILGRRGLDWKALAVLLANNVAIDSPLGSAMKEAMTDDGIVAYAVRQAAATFDTTPEAVLGESRYRNVLDARAVAMSVCRLAALSSPTIGDRFGKDHSTVLYAASRVGENPRLRRIANRIAGPLGIELYEDQEVA